MPPELHDQLADLDAKWLKRQGFAVIATDLTALGCRERADVIGFRSQCSAAIESKVSRADFLGRLAQAAPPGWRDRRLSLLISARQV